MRLNSQINISKNVLIITFKLLIVNKTFAVEQGKTSVRWRRG